jgi:hypothetical protein
MSKGKEYIQSHYSLDVGACGVCQTNVPCESKIPLKTGGEIIETS